SLFFSFVYRPADPPLFHSFPTRRSSDLGSLITSDDPVGLIESVADEIETLDGVADIPLATPNETADTGIIQVVPTGAPDSFGVRSEEHTSELQSRFDLVCRLLLEKKKKY